MGYLWVKAFHLVFVVMWYAGLMYLPRLFVYHTQASDSIGIERFKVMERKLFIIMTIGAALTLLLGLWMLAISPEWMKAGWMHAKLTFVIALIAYHAYCYKLVLDFRADKNTKGHVFYRWFNEVPAIILIVVAVLVIVKPF